MINPALTKEDGTLAKKTATLLVFYFIAISIIAVTNFLREILSIERSLPQDQVYNYLGDSSSYVLALYGVIYEELSFRLPLRYRFSSFCISISLIIVLTLKIAFRRFGGIDFDFEYTYLNFARDAVAGLTIYLLLRMILTGLQERISNLYLKNYNAIYYGFLLFWVCLHATNYSLDSNTTALWSLTASLITIFLLGLCFAIVRLRCGIVWSIVLHTLVVWSLLVVLRS